MDLSAFVRRSKVAARNGIRDAIAGVVASVVLVANIISFGALMFPGDLSAGIPIAIWAMLVGSCIGGLWIAWTTSLPPLSCGIDSPTGAVLVLLSATVASSVVHAGESVDVAVTATMLVFTLATLVSAAVLLVLGVCRWRSYFRFVPSSWSPDSGQDYETFAKAQMAAVSANRFGTPEEFGRACAFLCSADAGYIVGQNVLIDGSVNSTL